MTKYTLIEHLVHNEGLTRTSAIKAVDGVIRALTDTLALGLPVALRGFATIRPVQLAERRILDIRTGEPILIPARRSVTIIPGKELKQALNP